MVAAQNNCSDCVELLGSNSLKVRQHVVGSCTLWCDFSTGSPRPLVPQQFREAVFDSIHGIAGKIGSQPGELAHSRENWLSPVMLLLTG
jgi:hypothetical protein